MADARHGAGKPAVITVHGTGDTAPGPNGEKWFQNGSVFVGRLKESLNKRGVDAEVIPHLWSGANSANARENGARSLTKRIRQLVKQGRDIHIVGHSHGGNVANDAACMINWHSKQRRPMLSSITTVGTPFFKTHVTVSERLGAWAFVIMTWLSIVIIGGSAILFGFGAMSAQEQNLIETTVAGLGAFVIPSIIVLIFTIPIAFHGIGRIRRASRRLRKDTSLFSIWHPNDEAIAFLMRVEKLPIEPFPRWSFMRSSRTSAIVWGIRIVCLLPITGLILTIIALVANSTTGAQLPVAGMPMGELGLMLIIIGLLGGPIIFAVVYLLFRAAVGVFLEFGLRGTLNRSIGGVLKGLAFGRDGDNRIGDVAPQSHYYAVKKAELDGPVAQRMFEASTKATQELFNKYRGSMFAIGVNNSDAVNELATDAMTW
ncbi:MAG TPA: hypothetical protein VGO52_02865, partial [Hyphomonadaceae bacterium]|nr:hypothetical protein [Hyphomonadaceae bacterium]